MVLFYGTSIVEVTVLPYYLNTAKYCSTTLRYLSANKDFCAKKLGKDFRAKSQFIDRVQLMPDRPTDKARLML